MSEFEPYINALAKAEAEIRNLTAMNAVLVNQCENLTTVVEHLVPDRLLRVIDEEEV